MYIPKPGPLNAITDVLGIKVGHFTDIENLTGTTVVLCEAGAVGGVDVRGAAPGTRETDLLDPSNLVQHVQAVVLSGGSAFGLAAAEGVVAFLEERGIGFPAGGEKRVPIVPAAVLFDIGRGPDWRKRPDASYGYRAALAASDGRVAQGNVGAGTGARAGGLKGGMGTASVELEDGVMVAALIGLNSLGRTFDPRNGDLYARYLELGEEFGGLQPPVGYSGPPEDYRSVMTRADVGKNTTIGVIATNAKLDKAQARKVAQMAHDGLARAIRPAHTLFDGDTLFALSTGDQVPSDPIALNSIGAAAADAAARAIVHAMLNAQSLGGMSCYLERFPSARP